MKANLSVIILTFNEEKHLERCLNSVKDVAKDIFIVDSYSNDKTIEIAKKFNCKIYQNQFINQAIQFNWALDNIPITTEWVFRLDADEYLSYELIEEINHKLHLLPENISGVIMPRQNIFLGKNLKRGTGLVKLLRLFKFKKGRSEVRHMDEHIQLLEGETIEFENVFTDHNLNNLSWWTQKHNGYAIREAIDLLDLELDLIGNKKSKAQLSKHANAKRKKKYKYAIQPLFWRSFAYFIYRYFLKFGFIEGKEGFMWHFLQGWWYRTLVDAKIWEIKKACGTDKEKIKAYIKKEHGIEI